MACPHESWRVRIGWATLQSANGRRHQPWPTCIRRGMCVSGKRHRPTTGCISQGLHVSAMACVQRLGDIGKRQAALVKSCTHHPWCVCIGWVTPTSDNGRRHQPRPALIGRCLCPSGKRRRPTTFIISQGLHASVVACAHRQGDIGCGLRASVS